MTHYCNYTPATEKKGACADHCVNFLGTFKVKSGLAQMAKGGIVMDVVNAEQAKLAEAAGVGRRLLQMLPYTC
jgi:pyridoxal 5'-phosphate synthase pdxS subunit